MSSFALMSICLYQLIISDKLLINSGLLHRLQLTLYIKIWCCFISPTDPALLFIYFFGSCFSVGLLLFLLSFSVWSPIIIASFGCVWFVTALTPRPVFHESFLSRPTPLCVFHYLVFPVCSLPAALQAPVERRMKLPLTESRQNSRTVNSGSLCRAWIPSHSWGWNLSLSSLQNSILEIFLIKKKKGNPEQQ